MVPNCGIEAENRSTFGRICTIPGMNRNSSDKIQTLRENSFQVHRPRVFNFLPAHLRNMTKCSVDEFKMQLDLILAKFPDEPRVSGCEYTPSASDQFTGNPSNSIVDQIRGVSFPTPQRNTGR